MWGWGLGVGGGGWGGGGGGVGVVMHSLAPGVSDSTANKCSQLRMNLFLVRRVSGEELLCGYVVNGGETGKGGRWNS